MKKSIRLRDNAGLLSVMASVTSICIGLLFGLLLLLLLNPGNALAGMGNLLSKGFTDVGNVLYRAAPLIMVGLAVAFAYQVGLFNIGASGQYTVGTFLGPHLRHGAAAAVVCVHPGGGFGRRPLGIVSRPV